MEIKQDEESEGFFCFKLEGVAVKNDPQLLSPPNIIIREKDRPYKIVRVSLSRRAGRNSILHDRIFVEVKTKAG